MCMFLIYIYIYKIILSIVILLDGDIPNINIHTIHMWTIYNAIGVYTTYLRIYLFGNNLYEYNCDN